MFCLVYPYVPITHKVHQKYSWDLIPVARIRNNLCCLYCIFPESHVGFNCFACVHLHNYYRALKSCSYNYFLPQSKKIKIKWNTLINEILNFLINDKVIDLNLNFPELPPCKPPVIPWKDIGNETIQLLMKNKWFSNYFHRYGLHRKRDWLLYIFVSCF